MPYIQGRHHHHHASFGDVLEHAIDGTAKGAGGLANASMSMISNIGGMFSKSSAGLTGLEPPPVI